MVSPKYFPIYYFTSKEGMLHITSSPQIYFQIETAGLNFNSLSIQFRLKNRINRNKLLMMLQWQKITYYKIT